MGIQKSTVIAIQLSLCALLISLAVGIAYIQMHQPPLGIDDAHIFMSYGQSLARGQGFTYANDSEPVEGASSLLWTLLVSVAYFFPDSAEILLLIFVSVFNTITLYIIIRYADKHFTWRFRHILFLGWFVSSPSFFCMEFPVLNGLCQNVSQSFL